MPNEVTTPRSIASSITTMTEFVLPTHTNPLGSMFGGQVLAWIDLCAAICAQRHTGNIVITAAIDDLSFNHGIKLGQVAQLTARVTAAFRTSIEVLVRVDGEDAMTGDHWPCVTAFVTLVAVSKDLRPTAVPSLILITEEDHRLAKAAGDRRAARLARRHSP